MSDPPVLLGTRTRLRPWHTDDAEAIFRACQDPDTQRFTTIPSPYRREDADWFLAHHVHDVADEGGASFCVEAIDEPGTVAGSMALLHVRDGIGEIGYWGAPWARGRGYAADALGVVVAWVFGEGRAERLELLIAPENVASRAVARRAGFVVEYLDPEHLLGDGSVRPVLVHGLRASDRV
ncbi:GNAT family N-acetyltransferase [Actinomycetospora endophytica]|uniref:GNAT family N-acetyltransferase n=1 Tax=Actinomycetospora endophytica TaxID=2291215 RepID=A0ABS8P6G9_9PSEU|nr:GNAT family N-acetyltransferase [Actinomycetospora endophytica]MCD2193846.1 GNAT family N-acetyltransferase [Actinomycetospora endophytica]